MVGKRGDSCPQFCKLFFFCYCLFATHIILLKHHEYLLIIMSYYHEARAEKRRIAQLHEESKKRAERRKDKEIVEVGCGGRSGRGKLIINTYNNTPAKTQDAAYDVLRVDGRPCKLIRTNTQHHSTQQQLEGFVPWNGNMDCMVDRYDVRTLLDMVPRAPPPNRRPHKMEQELELEEVYTYVVVSVQVIVCTSGCWYCFHLCGS